MPTSLQTIFASDAHIDLQSALARLAVALLLGLCVSGIHTLVKRGRGGRSPAALRSTLVLLTVLLCLTTIVVGDNIARAFSIVGALSIVRFRTVVEDTRDTAFVIFAVVMGLAAGAGYLLVPLLALPIGAVAALGLGRERAQLVVRTALGFDRWDSVEACLTRRDARMRHCSSGFRRGGTEYEQVYELDLGTEKHSRELVCELARIEGVIALEARRG